jgi:hypothetical protein
MASIEYADPTGRVFASAPSKRNLEQERTIILNVTLTPRETPGSFAELGLIETGLSSTLYQKAPSVLPYHDFREDCC